jgi:predicted TIM-barrel fold metal-dependent hydrolase
VNRRNFLASASAAALPAPGAAPPIPIIDTHIHLFDPTRPQGVPWPPKDNAKLYQPALPPRFRQLAVPHGIVGAIEVECSPWLEDNQWVLDVMATDEIMVGTIGDLEPAAPDYRKHLERFRRNPLFLGIRYSGLWGRNFAASVANRDFIAGLKDLAAAGLTLDTSPPGESTLALIRKIKDQVPDLRIVLNHTPRMTLPEDPAARKNFVATLRDFAKTPGIYAKVSGILRRAGDRVPEDPAFYREQLAGLWDIFGEDRVVYGSDWPNSDNWGSYAAGFRVVNEYALSRGRLAAEKYFWRNSVSAYRWKQRAANQPRLQSETR